MLNTAVQAAINEQIKQEFQSAYIYLSMSAYFEGQSLTGFARWARLQSQEEVTHAIKLFDFLHDRGGSVKFHPIDAPAETYESPLAVFEAALNQERHVTKLIHDLYTFVSEEKDYPTKVMLEWFINEQVEEEKAGEEIVDRLRLVGSDPTGLLIMDSELGARKASPEAGSA